MTNFNMTDHEFYPIENGTSNPQKERPETEDKELKKIREKMKINFIFGPHMLAKDAKLIAKHIDESDVYIPEVLFHTPDLLKDFRKVSGGKLLPEKFIEKNNFDLANRFVLKELKLIYGTNKKIFFADLEQNDKNQTEDSEEAIEELDQPIFKNFIYGNLEEALTNLKQQILRFSNLQKQRNDNISEQLKTNLPEFIQQDQSLKNKPEIRILVSLGLTHTPPYIELKKNNYNTTRKFTPTKPIIFTPFESAIREKELEPDKELSRDLLLKIIMEKIISNICGKATQNYDLLNSLIIAVNKKISPQEIEELSKKLKENMVSNSGKNPTPEDLEKDALNLLRSLESKGIVFENGKISKDAIIKIIEKLNSNTSSPYNKNAVEKNKTQEQERGPEISYHFFFGPHQTKKDLKKLKEAFDEADIYIPERPWWGEDIKSVYKDLARGKIDPDSISDPNDTPTAPLIYKLIHKSGKPILIVDIPKAETELLEKRSQANLCSRWATRLFLQGDLNAALEKMRSYAEILAEVIRERERIIRDNLEKQIKEFLEKNPKYQKKEELKILVSLGSIHTNVYRQMEKDKMNVSREFNELPQVYKFFDELERRIVLNKSFDDGLLVRALIENIIHVSFLDKYRKKYNLGDDTNKEDWLCRKIASQLSLQDIQEISLAVSKLADAEDFELNFIKELEKRNIMIPKSEQEIDEMLGIKENK